MSDGTDLLIQAFRLWVTDNVPASGANWPNKAEIIAGLQRLAVDIGAAQAGLHTEPTIAARDTYYATPENRGNLVYVNNNNGSATDPANGVYEWPDGIVAPRLALGFYTGLTAVVQPLIDQAQAYAAAAATSAQDVSDVRGQLYATETVGRPVASPPAAGTGAVENKTYVFATPLAADGKEAVRVHNPNSAGPFIAKRFTGTPGNYTQIGPDYPTTIPNGYSNPFSAAMIDAKAGEYLGFYAYAASGKVSVTVGAPGDSGGFYEAAGNVSSITGASLKVGTRLEIGFDVISPYVSAAKLKAAEAGVVTADSKATTAGIKADAALAASGGAGTTVAALQAKIAALQSGSLTLYAVNPAAQKAAAAMAAAGSAMSARRQNRLSRLFDRLDAASITPLLTGLWLLGDTEAQWMVNLANPGTYNLSKAGAPTFTAGEGVRSGNNTANYYNTNLPVSAIGQNDHYMGVLTNDRTSLGRIASTAFDIGAVYDAVSGAGIGIIPFSTTANNPPIFRSFSANYTDSANLAYFAGRYWTGINRLAGGSFDGSHIGVKIASYAVDSIAPTTAQGAATVQILKASNHNFSSQNTVSGAVVARGMTEAQRQELAAATIDYVECVRWGDPMIYDVGVGDSVIRKDVIVYGLSCSSICYAYECARRGLSVALVGDWADSTIWDIGGMPSNGLVAIDARTPAAVSGVFREALIWIRTVFQNSTAPTQIGHMKPEPRGFQAAFRRMLDPTRTSGILPGMDIPVYMTGGITKANNTIGPNGPEINSITTKDGRTFYGRVFAEGSYDGDLIYRAGIPYLQGSEAAGSGTEGQNGFQPTALTKPVGTGDLNLSPYVIDGDATSGLLPDFVRPPAITTGAPDPALQPSNYRLTFTNSKGRYLPFDSSPPPGYSAQRYEIVRRAYAANTAQYGVAFPIGALFKASDTDATAIYDVNASNIFSTDMPNSGVKYSAAGADFAARRAIFTDVLNRTRGLLYDVLYSGDPRVPASLITAVSAFSLDPVNHRDPGPNGVLGWPKMMYRRDPVFGMRNTGFVLTGNDITMADGTAPRSTKTISTIDYRLDVHYLRVVNVGGLAYAQGGINNSAGGADSLAPWPLEASLPDKAVCTNLVSLTAPSMTRMAWSAARMEPAMAQAAECLASVSLLAIKAGIAVQDVDYPTVRNMVLTSGYTVPPLLPQVN